LQALQDATGCSDCSDRTHRDALFKRSASSARLGEAGRGENCILRTNSTFDERQSIFVATGDKLMLDSIIAFVATAVTGLTFVAYRHSATYHRLTWVVITVFLVLVVLATFYGVGTRDGINMCVRSLTVGMEKVNLEAYQLNKNLSIIVYVLVALTFYAIALTKLPWVLGLGEANRRN
jgi:hypothetical protein